MPDKSFTSNLVSKIRNTALEYHRRTVTDVRAGRIAESVAQAIGQADSLLDVGCGDGFLARQVAAKVGASQVEGVDVVPRREAHISIKMYDGEKLPYPDRSFDVVTIVDVLHHCQKPDLVLAETIRVCKKAVVVKDHFAFGPLSDRVLYWMDRVGNARDEIFVPGTYFSPPQWVKLVTAAGGRVDSLHWPVLIHDLPWRLVASSRLHFVARLVSLAGG